MFKKYWKVIRFAIPILMLLVIIATILFSTGDKNEIVSPKKGFLAPEFLLLSLEGQEVALSDYHGKVVVVNLWASWCPPCVAEMDAIQSAYAEYGSEGLEVLAVNMTYNDNLSDVRAFVNEKKIWNFKYCLMKMGISCSKL